MCKRLRILAIYCLIFTVLTSSISTRLYAEIREDSVESSKTSSHWAITSVSSLTAAGIIEAHEFDISEFDIQITRGRFIDLFVRILGFIRDTTETSESSSIVFTDVYPIDDYYLPIYYAYNLGIVNGYPDNSFRPGSPIERQDIFTIIGRAYEKGLLSQNLTTNRVSSPPEFTDNSRISDYAKPYVNMLVANEIIVGYQDASIRPTNTITCAEVITIVERIYQAEITAGSITESLSSNKRSMLSINKATATPKPSPTTTPRPTQVVPGGGGGNGNIHNDTQSSNNSSIGNNVPYEFDDTVEVDIDSVASLKNVRSINFEAQYIIYEQSTQMTTSTAVCNDTASMRLVIDALRSLKLWKAEPLPNVQFSGAFPLILSIKHTDGTTLDIHYQRYGLYINGLYYPILWNEEARHFEQQLIAALSRQNSAQTVNQLFYFFKQTDSVVSLSNSQKAYELLEFQVGAHSADKADISEQISLTVAALFNHDFGGDTIEYGYRVYRFDDNSAYGNDGSLFYELLSDTGSYWLAKLREGFYGNEYGLQVGKTEAGQWYCTVGTPPADKTLEMYDALDKFMHSSDADRSFISENISSSPLGATIDNLDGDVEDARFVYIGNNGAFIVYIRVGSQEFGYTLCVDSELSELGLNHVYSIQDIVDDFDS